jgi:hypothetical protein
MVPRASLEAEREVSLILPRTRMEECLYRYTFSLRRYLLKANDHIRAPAAVTPGEVVPVTHWTEGWVRPRADLDDIKKGIFLTLQGLELHSSVVQFVACCYTYCATAVHR